tara:strand:- start:186 stop:365 length:180 start_codon:yes stop_codon:yes gene_type:complete
MPENKESRIFLAPIKTLTREGGEEKEQKEQREVRGYARMELVKEEIPKTIMLRFWTINH